VRPALARYCGTLFSLGHGAVVMAIALGVSAAAGQWAVPQWFGTLGALISIGFLAALGMLNLAAVLRAGPDQVVQPVGVKGRLLGSLRHVSNPLAVALVGALFALSFDTSRRPPSSHWPPRSSVAGSMRWSWRCCSCWGCCSPTASTACGSPA
jgi:high-affinity nickel-transport protein